MKTKFEPVDAPLCEQLCIGLVSRLAALRFFPSEQGARAAIVDLMMAMCDTEQQAVWLVKRMTSGIYSEWPGLGEMRACFCSRFRPKDKLEAHSTRFPENNFPPDPSVPALPAAPVKLIPKRMDKEEFKELIAGLDLPKPEPKIEDVEDTMRKAQLKQQIDALMAERRKG